jgi:hypothetical protein
MQQPVALELGMAWHVTQQ